MGKVGGDGSRLFWVEKKNKKNFDFFLAVASLVEKKPEKFFEIIFGSSYLSWVAKVMMGWQTMALDSTCCSGDLVSRRDAGVDSLRRLRSGREINPQR